MGEGLTTCRQRYITLAWVLVAVGMARVRDVAAQERVIERHVFTEPEGRLLAYYSASMAFTPAGMVTLPLAARLAVGLEVSYIPALDELQRRPSIDKPESTNLAPLFPRPRVALAPGSGWLLEGSWIPPVRMFDVKANVASIAIGGPSVWIAGFDVSPRVWGMIGRVRGAITCAASTMLGHGSALESYYANVCHGRESDDWFEPRMVGAELLASRPMRQGTLRAYVGAGARVDRTRFDIGVLRADGSRDPDHPILELRATRPQFTVGVASVPRGRLSAGAELFYAPGSVFTVRATAQWTLRRRVLLLD